MRAIVMTACAKSGAKPGSRPFDPMAYLVDRPLLQHLVELLAGRGIDRFDFLLGDDAAAIEAAFGDGLRWGVEIRHHLIHDEKRPYATIRSIVGPDRDEAALLIHADHLVEYDRESPHDENGPVLILRDLWRFSSPENWTGWAIARRDDLLAIVNSTDREDLLSIWTTGVHNTSSHEYLSVGDDREMAAAQEGLLRGRFGDLQRSGREVEPGVWLSRNVSLHESAVIVAPVHIAEDCWIGPRVRLGPNVAVGAGSVLDEGTRFADALVMPRTYTGRGLDLNGVIVDQDRARMIASGAVLDPNDPTIFSEVIGSPIRRRCRDGLDRLAAFLLIPALAPLAAAWCLIARCRGRRFRPVPRAVVCIPAKREERRWKTFRLWSLAERLGPERPSFEDLCTRIWPGLFAVASGKLRLVGQPARSVDSLREMVRDTLDWSRSARPGLISEGLVRLDPDATPQEHTLADACHAMSPSLLHDLRLLGGYVTRLASRK